MAKLVMPRQQGDAPWRTQDGAFLLGKKKHRSDRYAYRTRLLFLRGDNIPFPKKLRETLASLSSSE